MNACVSNVPFDQFFYDSVEKFPDCCCAALENVEAGSRHNPLRLLLHCLPIKRALIIWNSAGKRNGRWELGMEEAEQTRPLRKSKVTSEVRLNERICALLAFEASAACT